MSDDYLWDKSGKPDPEIEKLERSLASLGHTGTPLTLPAPAEQTVVRPARPTTRPFGFDLRWAIAAMTMVVLGGVALWAINNNRPAWRVAGIEGAPRVGARALRPTGRLVVGEWLTTDAGSRARLAVGSIGEVLVEPNSRVRLLEAHDQKQRLQLELGTLTAVIVAPPRRFVVETPSAHAVDLGCAYTLEVDPTGGGFVTVLAGWVSFEREGRESFIPAGGRCATRPGVGPGTPYFTDASFGFKNALVSLDLASDAGGRSTPLAQLLPEARREDAFTLWHLLVRLEGDERASVYDRLAVLLPPPAGVTREGVMAGDRAMFDRWWDALGFGDMKSWRLWQRSWPEGKSGGPKVGPS